MRNIHSVTAIEIVPDLFKMFYFAKGLHCSITGSKSINIIKHVSDYYIIFIRIV